MALSWEAAPRGSASFVVRSEAAAMLIPVPEEYMRVIASQLVSSSNGCIEG
jgi:hypothetical protein